MSGFLEEVNGGPGLRTKARLGRFLWNLVPEPALAWVMVLLLPWKNVQPISLGTFLGPSGGPALGYLHILALSPRTFLADLLFCVLSKAPAGRAGSGAPSPAAGVKPGGRGPSSPAHPPVYRPEDGDFAADSNNPTGCWGFWSLRSPYNRFLREGSGIETTVLSSG